MYGKSAAGVLAQILGHIAFYCIDNKLPHLTTIVVGTGRGAASHGIPINRAKLDKFREKVYAHPWFEIYPPSKSEFGGAYSRHHSRRRKIK